jgi:hypothetical protein
MPVSLSNPYGSPLSEPNPPSRLTRRERRMLRFYREHRGRHLATFSLAFRNAPQWTAFVGIVALIYFLARLPHGPGPTGAWVLALLLGVFLAGAIVRDFGYARRLSQTWPLLSRILDWDEIDNLLSQGE